MARNQKMGLPLNHLFLHDTLTQSLHNSSFHSNERHGMFWKQTAERLARLSVLSGLAIAAGALPALSVQARPLAVHLLLLFAWLLAALERGPRRRDLLALIAPLLLAIPAGPGLLLLVPVHAGLQRLAHGKQAPLRINLALTSLPLIGLTIFAPLRSVLEPLAGMQSWFLSLVSPTEVHAGPLAAGLPLLLIMLAVLFESLVEGRKLGAGLLFLAGWLLLLLLHAAGVQQSSSVGFLPASWQLLGLLSLLPAAMCHKQISEAGSPHSRNLLIALLPGLLLSLGIWMSLAPGRDTLAGMTVLVRESGEWSAGLGRHAMGNGPRMGGFLRVLEAWGAELRIVSDPELLASQDPDMIVVIHPQGEVEAGLRNHLNNYMKRGGTLLVVGEHTNVHEIMTGVNSLLAGRGIRLRDDSAIPALKGWNWKHLQEAHTAGATITLGDSDDLGISIGGSLELDWPAFPLVSGRFAFADTGNPDNPSGKMGNSRPDPGERLSDIPLVAVERVGQGTLCVFGDTSGLMSLSAMKAWPFYLNLTRSLCGRAAWMDSAWLLLMLLVSTAVSGLIALRHPSRVTILLLLAGFLPATIIARQTQLRPLPDMVSNPGIVWLDGHHMPNWMMSSSMDWSVMSLAEVLMNADLLPLFTCDTRAFDLEKSELLIINAPARAFTHDELKELRIFVEAGGRLLISADGRRAGPVNKLLSTFGMRLSDTPLGTAPEAVDAAGTSLSFEFYEAWALEDLDQAADTLASCWGLPFILERKVGEGSVIAMGDEHILSRYMLEGSSRQGKPLNTAKRFMEEAQKRPSPKATNPALMDWEQRHRASLHMVGAPPPEGPKRDSHAAQDMILNLLNVRPSHRPGDRGQPLEAKP